MRLIASRGGWIEEDYKTEDRYFTGFLFWKSTGNGLNGTLQLLERNANDISSKIGALSRQAGAVVSRFTNPLKHLFPAEKLQEWDFPSTPVQINYQHPVLNAPVTRQCNVKNTETGPFSISYPRGVGEASEMGTTYLCRSSRRLVLYGNHQSVRPSLASRCVR